MLCAVIHKVAQVLWLVFLELGVQVLLQSFVFRCSCGPVCCKAMGSSGECPVCRCSAKLVKPTTENCDTHFAFYQRIKYEAKMQMEKKDWDKTKPKDKKEWAEAIKLYMKDMEKNM